MGIGRGDCCLRDALRSCRWHEFERERGVGVPRIFLFRFIGVALAEEYFDQSGAELLPEFMKRKLGGRRLGLELEDAERGDGAPSSYLHQAWGACCDLDYLVV